MPSLRIKPLKFILFISGLFLLSSTVTPAAQPASVREMVRSINSQRLRAQSDGLSRISGESIRAKTALTRFYKQRDYQLVWVGNTGVSPMGGELIEAIRSAFLDGLKADDYHLSTIQSLVSLLREKKLIRHEVVAPVLADLELLLTDAFLGYASHLWSGKVSPETIDPDWLAHQKKRDLVGFLNQALVARQIANSLDLLRPPQPDYSRLKKALGHYRSLAEKGGWPALTGSPGPVLKAGNRSPAVRMLRKRLALTGDWVGQSEADGSSELFDDGLTRAVSLFQLRHGLASTGEVNQETRDALNVPVEERVLQLLVNLERWRWLPYDLGNPRLLVNIPEFMLRLEENGKTIHQSRVIVGTNVRPTPVFSKSMTFLILNPFWYIPPGIAVDNILPHVKKDPGYLVRKQIRVFNSWEKDTPELDPFDINWQRVSGESFPFFFRQDPGPGNGLGRVKFMFPNQYDIYLHDTPNQRLFRETSREFSSGCIRVENPLKLAEYLLRQNENWDLERIQKVIEARTPTKVVLAQPVQIHLLYWTAWIDHQGRVHFRKDIYQRDHPLANALDAPP